jgi:hypothetical protein
MTSQEDRLNRVAVRAFEFARSGAFENMTALERKLVQEGFGEDMHWLERPGVRRSLQETSTTSRRLQMSAERASI